MNFVGISTCYIKYSHEKFYFLIYRYAKTKTYERKRSYIGALAPLTGSYSPIVAGVGSFARSQGYGRRGRRVDEN